ncbi:MAG: hypothetical protein FJ027_16125 [Candidatus Rokubacteria bacterium]|nr:hypothetical protein [Candidatus Rokubacteria bacterium]
MYRLSLRIDGDITIEAFRDAVTNFLRLLREVEESVVGESAVRWTLEELRRSSPAVMTWLGSERPRRRRRKAEVVRPDYAPIIGKAVISGIGKLERGQGRPESFSDEALEATMNLAKVRTRRGISALVLVGENGAPHEPPSETMLTERAAASVKEIVTPRYTAPGSIEGRLQGINSRGILYFVVYDNVYGSRVRCDIPPGLKREALEAFDHRVVVTGMVARDAEGHPRHIAVERIEPIIASSLPQSIRGLDPDFTGNLSTAEYLKRGWSSNP